MNDKRSDPIWFILTTCRILARPVKFPRGEGAMGTFAHGLRAVTMTSIVKDINSDESSTLTTVLQYSDAGPIAVSQLVSFSFRWSRNRMSKRSMLSES